MHEYVAVCIEYRSVPFFGKILRSAIDVAIPEWKHEFTELKVCRARKKCLHACAEVEDIVRSPAEIGTEIDVIRYRTRSRESPENAHEPSVESKFTIHIEITIEILTRIPGRDIDVLSITVQRVNVSHIGVVIVESFYETSLRRFHDQPRFGFSVFAGKESTFDEAKTVVAEIEVRNRWIQRICFTVHKVQASDARFPV